MNIPMTRGDAVQMLRRRLNWLERRIAEPGHNATTGGGGFMMEKEAAAIRFAIRELDDRRERRNA